MDAGTIYHLIEEAKDRRREYKHRIERLKPVKRVIAAKKAEFGIERNMDEKAVSQNYTWKGETYSSFQANGNSILNEDSAFYSHGLDYVLDSINDEITRLENKIARQDGIIGNLYAQLNSLANEFENATN